MASIKISRVLLRRSFPRQMGRILASVAPDDSNFHASLMLKTNLRRTYSSKTNQNIIKSPFPDIILPKESVHEYIWERISKWPDKVAIECGITGRKFTYSEIKKYSDKTSSTLQKKFGLRKNDCIAIILPNMPEYPLILLGASQAGLVCTTVNPAYVAEEISKQLKSSKAKVIFTVIEKLDAVNRSLESLGLNIPVVVVKQEASELIPRGCVDFNEFINDSNTEEFTPVPVSMTDVLALPYSSGTTGLPKGVQLNHLNLVSNFYQISDPRMNFVIPTSASYQEVILGVLPFYHIYGLTGVLLKSLSESCKIVTLPKFEPTTYIKALIQHKASILFVVPPLILFLGGHDEVKKEYLSSVRIAFSGAAPCGGSDIERLLVKCQHDTHVLQGYGLTETSPVVTLQTIHRPKKLSSVGIPVPSTNIKVVNTETGAAQPANKVGEIFVQGPQVMKGYLNNEEANKDIFAEGGWLKTGDLGYYDNDGDFFIVDRLKELIKVKGFQVAPAELEEILRTHPKIADAAVIGVPHIIYGESPKAFVVLKPNQSCDGQEVKDFVAKQTSQFKHLKGGVEFVKGIPKSAAGKILRRELRAIN